MRAAGGLESAEESAGKVEAAPGILTGATSGIGRHAALHLAGLGHRVFATGRNEKILAQVDGTSPARPERGLHKAAEAPASLETLVLDVTSADSLAKAKAEVDARTGGVGVDVLVNNAGTASSGRTTRPSTRSSRSPTRSAPSSRRSASTSR